jgi:UTP--glucose-1-phosphate uridylyltransferase
MKLRKAIIPAAGLGTRFLPATKALPKEMLPIVDKPTIQYIVEEAVASGIKEIIIIIGRGKGSIEDHFDQSYELEDILSRKSKYTILEELQKISNLVNIVYIRQKEPKGLGHAILCAKNVIGDKPFAVMLGDDIVLSKTPCLKQIIDVFEYYNSPVVAVQSVPEIEISKYGIIKPKEPMIKSDLFHIDTLIEKPNIEDAPSRFAIMGRYVLSPDIFEILARMQIGHGDELQLTDAIRELNKQQAVLAYVFEGIHYDIGDKMGFIKATIDFALKRDDVRAQVLAYLHEVNKRENLQICKSEIE